jgi:hypothetical protein
MQMRSRNRFSVARFVGWRQLAYTGVCCDVSCLAEQSGCLAELSDCLARLCGCLTGLSGSLTGPGCLARLSKWTVWLTG